MHAEDILTKIRPVMIVLPQFYVARYLSRNIDSKYRVANQVTTFAIVY